MSYIDVRFEKEATLEFFRDLVRMPSISPPGDEAPVADALADYFAGTPEIVVAFQEVGDNRKNIVATLAGTGESPAILLNGHLDVVATGDLEGWSSPPFGAEIKRGRVIGRGAGDMKGGLVALACAMKLLARDKVPLKGDVVLLGTCGEEIDGCGAKKFVELIDMRDFMCSVIAEPTGSVVVSSEKGAFWVEITSKGIPAHGSVPHTGVNAVEHLMETVGLIKSGFSPESVHPALGRTTMNIGTFHGGDQPNIVPDKAVCCIDFRTVPGYANEELTKLIEGSIASVMAARPGADITYRVINDRLLVATDHSDPVITEAVKLNGEMGLSTAIEGKLAITDGSILNTVCGTPLLIYGPAESSQAHVYDEYQGIEELYRSVVFYYNLILRLLS